VGRFIDRRGVGVQQLAFEVEDLSGLLAELKQAGVEVIGEEPVPGASATRIAFVHPKSTGGVLVELLEKSS
jgi:methylmalonyl-CoA epimerase